MTTPGPEEIGFAANRRILQRLLNERFTAAFGAPGTRMREFSGFLGGADGSPPREHTLKGQILRYTAKVSAVDGSAQDIVATIGHTDGWLPVLTILADGKLVLDETIRGDCEIAAQSIARKIDDVFAAAGINA